MRSNAAGLLLRPIPELDAEIESLRVYRQKLIQARDLRLSIARLEINEMDVTEMDVLVRFVAAANGLGESRLYEKTRQRSISEARFIVFWLARKHTTLSFTTIANHFGFDHSAVSYGVDDVEDLMQQSKSFSSKINKIESEYLADLAIRKQKFKPELISQ